MSIRFVTETEQVTKRCCKTTTKNISTDNVVYDRNDIKYDATTVVPKNTILSTALNNIVQFFKVVIDDIKQQLNISNVGTGAKVYAGNTLLGNRKLRTLVSSDDSVSIQETEDEVDITVLSEGGGGNQDLQSVLNNGSEATVNENLEIIADDILFKSNDAFRLAVNEKYYRLDTTKPDGIYTLATTDDIKLKEYTVATLPAGTKGDVAFVNNALNPTFLSPVVGGGSVVVRVFHNGTTWIVQ